MTAAVDVDEQDAREVEAWFRWVDRYEWHMDRVAPLLQQQRAAVTPQATASMDRPRVSGSGQVDPAPLRVDAVDDADALWGMLHDYVDVTSRLMGVCPWPRIVMPAHVPAGPAAAWRAGFVACAWLTGHVRDVVLHAELAAAEEPLFRAVRRGVHMYGLTPARPRRARRRPCPVCGVDAMTAEWVDVDGHGVQGVARCQHCGHTITGGEST